MRLHAQFFAKHHGRTFALLLVCGFAVPARADDQAAQLPPAAAAQVEKILRAAMTDQELVGLAVGVIREGKIAYLQTLGEADREARRTVTLETVFNWASNSKPVAAVLAMQLVQEGKLDLEADVRTYVPEFPEKGVTITTRHLLCHQSGLPHYANGTIIPSPQADGRAKPFDDPLHGVDRFSHSPLLFPPGQKVAYSSYAYVLLSAVLQRAAGEPFMDLTRNRIARPLKLASFEWDTAKLQPTWAVGYKRSGEQLLRVPDEAHGWKHGAGGFKSNIRDFARWAQALLHQELITAESEVRMWERQRLSDGSQTSWGLGFTLAERDGRLQVSHGGTQDETRTHMILQPAHKLGVVILCNTHHADVAKIADAVLAAVENPEP